VSGMERVSDGRVAEIIDALEFLTEVPLRDDAPAEYIQRRKMDLEKLSLVRELQSLRHKGDAR
jgi:hypothetical protein